MESVEGLSNGSFYDSEQNRHCPVELDGGHLYSLLSPSELPEDAANTVRGDAEEHSFGEWLASTDDDRIDLVKALLRGLILLVGREAGAEVGERRSVRRRPPS